ncbi:hypothetical protein CTAYLR_010184 [Chrysophaeum taylorii]|uniref:Uncharacterized protein n=1 Tax=Chrysophaeum taylorii TaxID=2483200 RepID=A0AAD7XJT8_9STRA|nr:hypothetical protein CTAYLR_010184 [Chrysophaeum taylorii]
MLSLILVASVNAFSSPVLWHHEAIAVGNDWAEAGKDLRHRSVSAAIVVDGGAPLVQHEVWGCAREGDANLLFDLSLPRDYNLGTAELSLASLWDPADAAQVAPQLLDLAERYAAVLEAATGNRTTLVRLRVTVATGARCTAPCPKIHADNVLMRCLVPVAGPGTVCVKSAFGLFGYSETLVPTAPGDVLFLKGRLWPQARPGRHRSPDPTEDTRILLAIDRHEDV